MTSAYSDISPDALRTLVAECGGVVKVAALLGVTRDGPRRWANGSSRILQRHVDALHAHLRGECPCCKRPL